MKLRCLTARAAVLILVMTSNPAHANRRPEEPMETRTPVDGASLYVRTIGQGAPVIVLHGGPGFDHRYLLPELDQRRDGFRLVY